MVSLTAWDWLVLVVGLVSVGLGLFNGLIRTVFHVAAWLLGILAALLVPAWLAANGQFGPVMWWWGGPCFVVAYLLTRVVGWLVAKGVSKAGLGAVDRVAGGLFGVVRALLVLAIVVGVARGLQQHQGPQWQVSVSKPLLDLVLTIVEPWLPISRHKVLGSSAWHQPIEVSMCGILGVVAKTPVNQLLYDGLLLLQHRGQDAAGIATATARSFAMHKASGLVRDVFRTRNMRSLPGSSGIAHVRYPTAGSANNDEEAQPFYVNAPYGITLAHNGNLTNSEQLGDEMFSLDRRHINTASDSEVLLNVLAHALMDRSRGRNPTPDDVFAAVAEVHARAQGAYACVAQIAGQGIVAFRDPMGIRPLIYGISETDAGTEYLIASESVALEGLGFRPVRDIAPGEAVFIDLEGNFFARQCAATSVLNPCAFEYVYFARPDSVIDGVSVYAARLKMGEYLAREVQRQLPQGDIDVVMPIPDTSRPSAMQLAFELGIDYREGFVKNRYVGRTFIMPGQATRKKSVRQKLNAMSVEFKGKNVLLVDDSIVRGTTSLEIVQMARAAGANKVFFASAAPPVRYPNVYGIDMPTRNELIAHGRSDDEICRAIQADALVYQGVDAMKQSIRDLNPAIPDFEASCFDGRYITGQVTPEYLNQLEAKRAAAEDGESDRVRNQLNLQLSSTL
jgi:amidophosphoribosyltransferase